MEEISTALKKYMRLSFRDNLTLCQGKARGYFNKLRALR